MFNSTFIGSFTAYTLFSQKRAISIFGSIWKEVHGTERVNHVFFLSTKVKSSVSNHCSYFPMSTKVKILMH